MTTLSLRTDSELIEELDHLAQLEQIDRATIARRILKAGLLPAKLEIAAKLYMDGASLGKAAETAKVSLWAFIDYLEEKGITRPFDEGEVDRVMKTALGLE
ncbi:MAG: UPF0175 family protein [Candidatus Hodarchaeales archaeon]|jgi:predicted transcriptional regulator